MQFSIATLGCKSNQFESQAMAKLLRDRGHTQGEVGDEVDVYIINTCSVTAVSDKKSRQLIRKVLKKNPSVLVAVCGCYAQSSPEEIAALNVDLIGGTGDHVAFITSIETLWQQHNQAQQKVLQEEDVLNVPKGNNGVSHMLPQDDPRTREEIEWLPSGGMEGRTRALLKIQDGCNNYCTYCIIPYTRGNIRSLPWDKSKESILDLATQGFSEIVLTGIEISSWGKDLKEEGTLEDFLVQAHCVAKEWESTQKIPLFFRLGSLEPRTITETFCKKVSPCLSVRPHFHLSLQSGSDTVLKRMNRKYDTARFYQSVSLLRQYFGDRVAITTDVIVGFPQETTDEFQETLQFLEQCKLSSVHVFPYSKRSGTVAADKMTGHLTSEVKEQRSKEASILCQQLKQDYESQFLGEEIPVLFESEKNGIWTGHSPHYVAVSVASTDDTPLQNVCKTVRIVSTQKQGLWGELVPSSPS